MVDRNEEFIYFRNLKPEDQATIDLKTTEPERFFIKRSWISNRQIEAIRGRSDEDIALLQETARERMRNRLAHKLRKRFPSISLTDLDFQEMEEQIFGPSKYDKVNPGRLSPRDQLVLGLRISLEDKRSRALEQIGRMYGVTKSRIQQLEQRGIKDLVQQYM